MYAKGVMEGYGLKEDEVAADSTIQTLIRDQNSLLFKVDSLQKIVIEIKKQQTESQQNSSSKKTNK